MNDKKAYWVIVAMAAIMGALTALLAAEYVHQGSGVAYGESAEPAAAGNGMLALMGNTTNDAMPIVLVDTKAQAILVYEYMVSTRTLFLRVARTYDSDRELKDNGFFTGNAYSGPTVADIRRLLGARR